MSQFERTRWVDNQFVQDYRDDAGIYLPHRMEFYDVARRSVQYFHTAKKGLRVLDLGCGDGLFAQGLLPVCAEAEFVLLDGSPEMLDSARTRLAQAQGVEFVKASFQELLQADPLAGRQFDFVFSSLAIHHLALEQKTAIYRYALEHLAPSGHFLNYDAVLAPTEELERWNMHLWRIWIEEHPDREGAQRLRDTPEKYQANSDNIPDTLQAQLNALGAVGFHGVDCFFKYGPFALFGGWRSSET